MKTELFLFKNIFLLSALMYPTDSNYTDYNPESMPGEADRHNRDNSVADSDGLKSGQSRGGHPDLFILLDENVPNNGEPEAGLFQVRAGVKIVDRDNTPRRPGSRIRSEYRGTNSRISLALSDSQMVEGVIRGSKDEGNDNDRDKKSSPPVWRSIPIISLVPCEEERVNIDSANQDQIRHKRASDLFRADLDSELERRLIANEEEQAGINAGENDKGRNNADCRQEEDQEIGKD
jgi:hypothetical protein